MIGIKSIFLPAWALLLSGNTLASITISLTPGSGVISGTPGQTIGWGFNIQPDATLWTSFVSSLTILETNPSLGVYMDFIGAAGGPVASVLPPSFGHWDQAFSNTVQTGLGSFTINQTAVAGSFDSGTIVIDYGLFTQDPNICTSCFVSPGETRIAFEIRSVPEPRTSVLFIGALPLAAFFLLKRHRRRAETVG